LRGIEPLELTRAAQPTPMMHADRELDALPHPPIDSSDHAVNHGRELIRLFRRGLTQPLKRARGNAGENAVAIVIDACVAYQ
jgi:hypothetical protein